jgi:putative N6-adenine-specific DNA methylase
MPALPDTFDMIVKTMEGLEPALEAELQALGAEEPLQITRGVRIRGDKQMLYSINYSCRTALRVLVPLKTYPAQNDKMLYEGAFEIPWENYLLKGQTFAIDSVISYSSFQHSGYVSLKVKDAITDRFRDRTGTRPSVDKNQPDLKINVRIFRDECTVSLDSSGDSLHIRRYKQASVEAPLNEVLASGLILLSEWNRATPLVDPMCGSGTILTEAALIASRIPPGYFRKHYSFMRWPDFSQKLWRQVKDSFDSGIIHPEVRLFGSDKDRKAFEATKKNIEAAEISRMVRVRLSAFEGLEPPVQNGFMITNPPYGERLKLEDIIEFYKKLGDILKHKYSGYTAWILGSDLEAIKFIGLHPSKKIKVMNGPLECRFLKFDLYQGSKSSG